MGGKPWRGIAEKVLPLPLAQVWELLSNTEHLNRTIGLPSVVYEAPVVTDDDFYRHASIKLLGFIPVRWKEYPFSWVRYEHYSVLRVFGGSPGTDYRWNRATGEPNWDYGTGLDAANPTACPGARDSPTAGSQSRPRRHALL